VPDSSGLVEPCDVLMPRPLRGNFLVARMVPACSFHNTNALVSHRIEHNRVVVCPESDVFVVSRPLNRLDVVVHVVGVGDLTQRVVR